MAARPKAKPLEPRHVILGMVESFIDGGDSSSKQLTTLTPSDPFLTAMDFQSTSSFSLTSATSTPTSQAEGSFGADPAASSSESLLAGSTIVVPGKTSPAAIFGTSTVAAQSTTVGSLLFATGSSAAPSSSVTQVLYPSPSDTLDSGIIGGTALTSSQSPSKASSASSSAPASSTAQTQSSESSATGSSNLTGGALAAAIVVPIIALVLFATIGIFVARRRQRRRNLQNDEMFAPETAERDTGASPGFGHMSRGFDAVNQNAGPTIIPWPLAHTSGQQQQQNEQSQGPKTHGSRPSLVSSNPFGDSRVPSNASQHIGSGAAAVAPAVALPRGAQQAEKGLLAPQPLSPQSQSRPRTAKSEEDAISVMSDVEYQQATVGIAHRVSVVNNRRGSSPPHNAR